MPEGRPFASYERATLVALIEEQQRLADEYRLQAIEEERAGRAYVSLFVGMSRDAEAIRDEARAELERRDAEDREPPPDDLATTLFGK